jgi:hypothetical protein
VALDVGRAEEALLSEIVAATDDLEQVTEAEFTDPSTYTSASVNNLPAIRYALSLGLPVTVWKPLVRNVGSEERALRASRTFSESARLLLVALVAGDITEQTFYSRMGEEYTRYARNSYIAGRRAVGVLAPMTAEEIEDLDSLLDEGIDQLKDLATGPVGIGLGGILASMIFDPTNYLGSGLPGDPFASLPQPIGAGKKSLKQLTSQLDHLVKAGKKVPENLTKQIAQMQARDAASKGIGKFAQRVDRAADDIWSMQHRGEQRALSQYVPPEATLVWWTLGPADHCIDCVRLSDASPFYGSVLSGNGIAPGTGHTRCMGKCRCVLEYDIPSVVCTDPLAGAGALGDLMVESKTDLMETSDGGRLNVWVQEAAACLLPASIDSFAGDIAPEGEVSDDLAYDWGEDAGASMAGSVATTTFEWSDLTKALSTGRSIPGLSSPAGFRDAMAQLIDGPWDDLLFTRYETAGAAYHVAWRKVDGAIRIEFGATSKGIGVLDQEFALKALNDLGAEAERLGMALEVNGANATNGLQTFLSVIGAKQYTTGATPPTVVPRWLAQPKTSAPLVTSHKPPRTPLGEMEVISSSGKGAGIDPHLKGGVNPKKVLQDADGKQWLIKYAGPLDEDGLARAVPEALATQIHETLGNNVAAAGVGVLDGEGVTVQYLRPAERLYGSFVPMVPSPLDMTPEHRVELARQWVVDILTGNSDGHAGNWMVEPDGRLLGVDKGLGFWNLPHYRYALGDTPDATLAYVDGVAVDIREGDHNIAALFLHSSWDSARGDGFFALEATGPEVFDEILSRVAAWDDDAYMALVERAIPGLIAGSTNSPKGALMGANEWRRAMLDQKSELADIFSRSFRDALTKKPSKHEGALFIPPEWKKWLDDGGKFHAATPARPLAQVAELATEAGVPGPVVGITMDTGTEGAHARYVPEDGSVHMKTETLKDLDTFGAQAMWGSGWDANGKYNLIYGVDPPPTIVAFYGGEAQVFAHEIGHAFEAQFDLMDADFVRGLGRYDVERGFIGYWADLGVGHKEFVWNNPSEAAADAFALYVQVPERMDDAMRAWVEARLADRPEWRGIVEALRAQPDPRFWARRGSVSALPKAGTNGHGLLPEVEALQALPNMGRVKDARPPVVMPLGASEAVPVPLAAVRKPGLADAIARVQAAELKVGYELEGGAQDYLAYSGLWDDRQPYSDYHGPANQTVLVKPHTPTNYPGLEDVSTFAITFDGDGKAVAALYIRPDWKGRPHIAGVIVEDPGKGYGTRLYDWVQDNTDVNLYDIVGVGDDFTPEGRAFSAKWLEHRRVVDQALPPAPAAIPAAVQGPPVHPRWRCWAARTRRRSSGRPGTRRRLGQWGKAARACARSSVATPRTARTLRASTAWPSWPPCPGCTLTHAGRWSTRATAGSRSPPGTGWTSRRIRGA